MKEPLALTAIMLLYSNLFGWLGTRRGNDPGVDTPFKFANPLLLVVLIVLVSKWRKQKIGATLAQMGLGRKGAGKSLLVGAAVGTALSAPPLLFFARPVILDSPVEFSPAGKLSGPELLRLLFVDMAIGVGLCEEGFFRGLLENSWGRVLPAKGAIAASAATFGGWHFAVTLATLDQTNVLGSARLPGFLRPHAKPIALVGGMLTTAVAGAIFSAVRQRTNSLWGAILAHWLVDSVMIAALWRKGRGNVKREA